MGRLQQQSEHLVTREESFDGETNDQQIREETNSCFSESTIERAGILEILICLLGGGGGKNNSFESERKIVITHNE